MNSIKQLIEGMVDNYLNEEGFVTVTKNSSGRGYLPKYKKRMPDKWKDMNISPFDTEKDAKDWVLKDRPGAKFISEASGQYYAARATFDNYGFVIFGPYKSSKEAIDDSGPSLEAILDSSEVSRKTRQKIDRNGQATMSKKNYKAMIGDDG